MLNTPVLLIIFNRPDTTRKVFERIRAQQPKQLFIAADGPRANRPNDLELTKQARAIADLVDWECELHTLYRDENLGCGPGPYTAIDWFFSHVDRGIILEDDCIASDSFFKYCDELLEKYKDDERIMMISGDNYGLGKKFTDDSYYFSQFTYIWGWATWRRAWQKYDYHLRGWEEFKKNKTLEKLFDNPEIINYFSAVLDEMVTNPKDDAWDFQWTFTVWREGGISINPAVNLISNVGFGDDATHTVEKMVVSDLRTGELEFPLKHPEKIEVNKAADNFTFRLVHMDHSATPAKAASKRLRNMFRKVVPKNFRQKLKSLLGR